MAHKKAISANLPDGLIKELQDIQKELDLDDFTQALKYAAKIGVFIHKRRQDLQDPPIVAFLKDNFRNELLIDWFASLQDDDIRALYGAIADERRSRLSMRKPHEFEAPPRRVV